ncbi:MULTISPECIES: antibiotic biosynthesis monooxygenase family protein [Inquilinus]|jgi:heme-degrading monooxygenase HmoA|uniref:Heme-degrading monooxygenase HmoA n=1 Tax=Inquilinus ginsengisoli TaxID=363840 RepID=A0ABU1JI47_9PROT|nr:antibiotic biosynthesis monooxygenase [Inquilinus ginsengisoli]MDR6288291.1 heme-degrading monooxygenase HmoA [Inquilinus ginsengisoli]
MITRVWRGYAPLSNPSAYAAHFRDTVLPALRGIAGFQGASLLRHDRPDEVEYMVLTRWDSMDAVRAFAGEDPDRAVVEPEAVAALTRFDVRVRHYTAVEDGAA